MDGRFFICNSFFYAGMYIWFRKKIYLKTFSLKEKQNYYAAILLEQISKIKFIKIHSLFSEYGNKLGLQFKDFWDETKSVQLFLYILWNILFCCSYSASSSIFMGRI